MACLLNQKVKARLVKEWQRQCSEKVCFTCLFSPNLSPCTSLLKTTRTSSEQLLTCSALK